MKKTILIFSVCLLAGTVTSYAQLSDEQKKERQEMLKESKSQLSEKASKIAQKEAKKLEKEASERPNDPISTSALKVQMANLAEEQERQKQEMQAEGAYAERVVLVAGAIAVVALIVSLLIGVALAPVLAHAIRREDSTA